MSDRDYYLSSGNPWTYGLSALLFCLAFIAWCWVALHAGPYLLTVWRRGRSYRRQMRNARHRRGSLRHLNFRSPVRD